MMEMLEALRDELLAGGAEAGEVDGRADAEAVMSFDWYKRVGSRVLRGAAVVAAALLAIPLILFGWCFWIAVYAFAFFVVITSPRRTLFQHSEKCR